MWRLHLKTFMVPPSLQTWCQVVRCQGLPEKASRASREETYRDRSSLQSPDVTCERRLTRTECAELSECELTELLQRCFDRSTIRPSVSREGRCTVCPRERVGLEWDQCEDDCLRKSPATWTFFSPPLKLPSSFLTSRNASVALNELPKERSERLTSVTVAAPIHLVGHHPVTLARWQIDWH